MALMLVCPCGFESTDAHVFVDHLILTKHLQKGPDAPETAEIADMVQMYESLQAVAAAQASGQLLDLPDGMDLRPVSREDILTDDDLSEEDKETILSRLDAIEQGGPGAVKASDEPTPE